MILSIFLQKNLLAVKNISSYKKDNVGVAHQDRATVS